jgi:hypothetical protein
MQNTEDGSEKCHIAHEQTRQQQKSSRSPPLSQHNTTQQNTTDNKQQLPDADEIHELMSTASIPGWGSGALARGKSVRWAKAM